MTNDYAVTLKSLFHLFIYIFFVKDPCKKCLVSSCCSELCENKIIYLSYCDIEGNINHNRFCVLSIIIVILTVLYGIIKSII